MSEDEEIFFDFEFDSDDATKRQRNVNQAQKMAGENFSPMMDITPFSGDDKTHSSDKWAEEIEDNAEIFGWTETQKLVVARRSLVGTAKLWLQSERTFKKYGDLKTALLKEFPDCINTKEMHELMANRKKREDESYYQYMLVMKELGRRARFADYVAIQYIIDGIQDYEPNKSILYGATTYAVLKDRLCLYENMKSKMPKKDVRPAKQDKEFKQEVRRCFNCGQEGHMAGACKNGIKCFRCDGYNHVSSQCPSAGSTNAGDVDVDTTAKQLRDVCISGPCERARQQTSQSAKQSTVAADTWCKTAMFSLSTISANDEARSEDGDILANGSAAIASMASASDSDVQHSDYAYADNDVNKHEVTMKMTVNRAVKVINLCGIDVEALIDTGSDLNLMNRDVYNELEVRNCDNDEAVLSGLGMSKIRSSGKFFERIIMDNKCYDDVAFHVVPSNCMPYKVILGQEFLKNVVTVMREGSVSILREDDWLARVDCLNEDNSVNQQVEQMVSECKSIRTNKVPIELSKCNPKILGPYTMTKVVCNNCYHVLGPDGDIESCTECRRQQTCERWPEVDCG